MRERLLQGPYTTTVSGEAAPRDPPYSLHYKANSLTSRPPCYNAVLDVADKDSNTKSFGLQLITALVVINLALDLPHNIICNR